MLIRFLSLFFLTLVSLAFADAQDIKDSIAARLPDNAEALITPEDVRNSFGDVIDGVNSLVSQTARVRSIMDFGAQGGGAVSTSELAAAQALAADACANPGTIAYLSPPSETITLGTDAALNTEAYPKFCSNTTVVVAGNLNCNINNGGLACFSTYYDAITDVSRTYHTDLIGLAGNRIDTISRTTSQTRKGPIWGNCTDCVISGLNISATSDFGSFMGQVRNPERVLIENNYIAAFPTSGGAGGDGFHIHGRVTDTIVINNIFKGEDDGCSGGVETSSMNNMTIHNLIYINNRCSSYRNSGWKLHNESNGAQVDGLIFANNYVDTWGPPGVDGNAFVITAAGNASTKTKNVLVDGNIFDCTNCEKTDGSGSGPMGSIDGNFDYQNENIVFQNNIFKGWQNRGVEITTGANNITFQNNKIVDYLGTSVTIVPQLINEVSRSAADTQKWKFPAGVITGYISASTSFYVSTTAGAIASNTGKYLIIAVDVTNSIVSVRSSDVSTSSDQLSGTAVISASITFDPGYFFYQRNAKNVTIKDNEFIGGPQFAFLTTASGIGPSGTLYEGNVIKGFYGANAIQISTGSDGIFRDNKCIGSTGDVCINEASSAGVFRNQFIDNFDNGSRHSFKFSDPDYTAKYNNIGTNSDNFDFRPLNLINAATISATSGTFTTSLTAGNISLTTGSIRALSISATNVSATGNMSAVNFFGSGAGLTGITASASPSGAIGAIPVNYDGVSTSGTTISYNTTTLVTNFTNGVSISAVVSATGGINAAAASGADIYFGATNDNIDFTDASNRYGFNINGTEEMRLTTSALNLNNNSMSINAGLNTPTATLEVSGTANIAGNISTTTGYFHTGSPTTIPTCDATNKGNVYMNTTTNCLVYCNGTSATTISSAASGCS